VGHSSIKSPKNVTSPRKLLSRTEMPLQRVGNTNAASSINGKTVVRSKFGSPSEKNGGNNVEEEREASD